MIGKLHNYIKRKKEIITNFNENTKYMCSGEYILDDSLKYFTRNDFYTKKRAYKMLRSDYYPFSIKAFILVLRKTLFRKNITIPDHDLHIEEFSGTVYRPVRSSNGYSDSKIFDLSQNKVLSIFSDEHAYQSVIENYEYFKVHFPLPAILWKNNERLLIMEELVLFQPRNTWTQEDYLFVMNDIFDRYFIYYKECIKKENHSFNTPLDLLNSLKKHSEINFIKNQITPEILQMKIPYIKLHGDLWTSNTLLTKTNTRQVKYIDWEYTNELIFFYDIFNMIWLEFYVNNNGLYLEKYTKGEYDFYLKRIFSLFNITFNAKYRIDYFNIFFLNFFIERLSELNTIDKNDYINQYKRFLTKIS
ncbi:hypothetical protein ABC255_05795 [Neobacillus sp. 3P2-tot-E-2]|uniref:hypothetical protein n=1 Tax=Neobacillus sp. 3P2-tot-E-2 TaxID=3132212 RepID=UPI0039A31983